MVRRAWSDWEGECAVTLSAFVFSLSGNAGMSALCCVTDLVQAAHSCVTLQETVLAGRRIAHFLPTLKMPS